MNNGNKKTFERILEVNKNSISVILYTAILLSAARIIYLLTIKLENLYEYAFSIIPPSVVIFLVALLIWKIKKAATLDRFDDYFTCIFTVLLSIMFLGLLFRTLLSVEIKTIHTIKSFYRISSVSMLFLASKINLENKWLRFIYYSYFLTMVLSLLILQHKEKLSDIQDDLIIGIFQIIISITSYNASNKYNDEFKKLYIKNEINIGRLTNIFNNIKQILISINVTKYLIYINSEFDSIIKHIDLVDIYQGFCLESQEDIDNFKKMTKTSDFHEFLIQFALLERFNKQETKVTTNFRKLKFFKKLYFLFKIFKHLKNTKSNDDLNIEKIFESEYFCVDQKFFLLDRFSLKSKLTKENEYYDVSFRRSKIYDVEIFDIMLANNTEVIKIEQEKADNKYRKSYLSNVAHEFKAPIQVLMISVNELSKLNFPKSAANLFKDIENLGNYIFIMIMDIISFSKEDLGISVKFETFESKNPFNFGFQLLQLLIRHNNNKCFSITPELYINENVPTFINSDENRIKQLIVNLISNAYKFTLTGKIIIKVSLTSSNCLYDEILVQVEDSGIGVSKKDQDRLFNQFEKLQDTHDLNKQGSGLGLFICKSIVSKIGIKIGFKEKRQGQGSIFYFSFANMKNLDLCKQIEDINLLILKDCIDSYIISKNIDLDETAYIKNLNKDLAKAHKNKSSKFIKISNNISLNFNNIQTNITALRSIKENPNDTYNEKNDEAKDDIIELDLLFNRAKMKEKLLQLVKICYLKVLTYQHIITLKIY